MPADDVSTCSTKGDPRTGRSRVGGVLGLVRGAVLRSARAVGAVLGLARAVSGVFRVSGLGAAFLASPFEAVFRAPAFEAAGLAAPAFFMPAFFAAPRWVATLLVPAFRAADFFETAFLAVEVRRGDFFAAAVLRDFVAMMSPSLGEGIVALSRCGTATAAPQSVARWMRGLHRERGMRRVEPGRAPGGNGAIQKAPTGTRSTTASTGT
jgi:hypothetical protein